MEFNKDLVFDINKIAEFVLKLFKILTEKI